MINKRYWVEESYLTSMADVIRNKTGKTDKILFPDGFFDEIANIETTPATALPVLDSNYPEDVTVIESANIKVNFTVNISIPGVPAEYTYQWYMDGVAINGATNSSWSFNGEKSKGTYNVYCEVKNEAGTITSRISKLIVESYLPEFTYSGNYELIEDGNYNWRIKFLTSGVLKFTKVVDSIQVFLVGGGGGGGTTRGDGGGGGGGYTKTFSSEVEKNVEYTITVGGGGSVQSNGGDTTVFGQTANGGKAGWGYGNTGDKYRGIGGNGGSGGAGGGGNEDTAGAGGSNGSNGGKASYHAAGTGQGTTTKEFGESNGTLYSGGGGAGKNIHDSAGGGAGGAGGGGKGGSQNIAAVAGTTNLGGGGGGGGADGGGKAGGSGIVIIRNIR